MESGGRRDRQFRQAHRRYYNTSQVHHSLGQNRRCLEPCGWTLARPCRKRNPALIALLHRIPLACRNPSYNAPKMTEDGVAGNPSSDTNAGRISDKPRQAVLVLGMHRSGTSAVAGTISALGAALPRKTLMGADPCNERGFFESYAIAVAHDQMLAAAGSHWHDWREVDMQRIGSAGLDRHRNNIKQVLIDEFGEEPFFVLKDPRICRFVPFIVSILAEINAQPVAVLPLRNPLEVVSSLQRRNQFAPSKSALLWLRHALDSEFYSRRMPRCFISYERFLTDWRHYMDLISERTGIAWPNRAAETEGWIDTFLSTDLRHEQRSLNEFGDYSQIPPLVRETYEILMRVADGEEGSEALTQLNRIRRQFNEGCQIFGPTIAAEELAAADKILVAERDSLLAAHNHLLEKHDALSNLYQSAIRERDASMQNDSTSKQR